MEIGYILNELWRRRSWVTFGFVIAVFAALTTVYRLPSFEKKSFELGSASTEVLVDAPRSPLAALGTDPKFPNANVATLVTRAQVYARLMESEPVRVRISRELGVSPGSVATRGPQPGVNSPGQETSAPERGNELLTESNQLRLFATSSSVIPIVSLFAQAANAEDAIKLADAGARALADYVGDLQEKQSIAPQERIQIQQLGAASGGIVNQGVDKIAAMLMFLGVFGFWCLLVLLASRTMLSWRAAGRAHATGVTTDRDRSAANRDSAGGPSARDEMAA